VTAIVHIAHFERHEAAFVQQEQFELSVAPPGVFTRGAFGSLREKELLLANPLELQPRLLPRQAYRSNSDHRKRLFGGVDERHQ
jgi:hypothetical protein